MTDSHVIRSVHSGVAVSKCKSVALADCDTVFLSNCSNVTIHNSHLLGGGSFTGNLVGSPAALETYEGENAALAVENEELRTQMQNLHTQNKNLYHRNVDLVRRIEVLKGELKNS